MTDKRRHRRSFHRIEVELSFPEGGTQRAVTRDMSISGVFVELTGKVPALGTLLTIIFLSSSHHPEPYSMRARVQRLSSVGIAMTFVDFSLDDLSFIEKLLSP